MTSEKSTFVILNDGAKARQALSRGLGFSEPDRVKNNRKLTEVSKLLADAGLVVLASFISPIHPAETRSGARGHGHPEFAEVLPLSRETRRYLSHLGRTMDSDTAAVKCAHEKAGTCYLLRLQFSEAQQPAPVNFVNLAREFSETIGAYLVARVRFPVGGLHEAG